MKPGVRDFLWMATGAVLLLGVVLMVLRFQRDPAVQLELKARRLELVNQVRLSLTAAAEAEKRAVMATTDAESQSFADEVRAATFAAEKARGQLEGLLSPAERNLFGQFSQSFTEFRRIDKDLLDLAVKNTNVKASNLAFGPAAAAVKELDAALAQSASPAATQARVGAWRLLASLPAHIAEESDTKMDAMEADMAKEDREVRRALDELANPAATAGYAKFSELRTQILKLSRENTNVRSLTISLTQKRKVVSLCQDALTALQQAIQNEPIAGTARENPVSPR